MAKFPGSTCTEVHVFSILLSHKSREMTCLSATYRISILRAQDCLWWRHQLETFSALLAISAGNSPVPVKSPHKGQWRGALMFSLICARINGWVNNREAGDLRLHRAHYDVTVMYMYRNVFVPFVSHCVLSPGQLAWVYSDRLLWPHITGKYEVINTRPYPMCVADISTRMKLSHG